MGTSLPCYLVSLLFPVIPLFYNNIPLLYHTIPLSCATATHHNYSIPYNTTIIPYHTIPYHTTLLLYHTIQYNTIIIPYHTTLLLYHTIQQVLQSVQRDAYDNLTHHWQDMAIDTMCALINDNQRMREKCDEFGEYVLRFVEEGMRHYVGYGVLGMLIVCYLFLRMYLIIVIF